MALREIVLDTETTGLDPADGHRVVEIGAVELVNHVPSGRTFHEYIDPQRDMPTEAFQVHGISAEMLRGKPLFGDIAAAFVDFIGDATLVIHNAPFDIGFLNFELRQLRLDDIPMTQVIDTLAMARKRFPGSPNNLDALCRRFGVDMSARVKHGALLDSELLADVYLELIGGRQSSLLLAGETSGGDAGAALRVVNFAKAAKPRPAPLGALVSEDERIAHEAFIETLGEAALWKR